jgi:hypothetical protein
MIIIIITIQSKKSALIHYETLEKEHSIMALLAFTMKAVRSAGLAVVPTRGKNANRTTGANICKRCALFKSLKISS